MRVFQLVEVKLKDSVTDAPMDLLMVSHLGASWGNPRVLEMGGL